MWQTLSYNVVLVFEAAVGILGIRLSEEPHYAVVDRIGDRIEIRRYASRVAAEVELPAAHEGRSNAFRLLFAYISGANHAKPSTEGKIAMTVPVELREPERIAMTAPVETADSGNTVRMRFFLPAQFTPKTAPEPTDSRVRIVSVPEEMVGLLRFSGDGSDMAERQRELVRRLSHSRWEPVGTAYALYYDAPFTLPFLRRNEAAVTVTKR